MTDRITIPADAILLHREPIEVRWGDMDAFRHVNNVAYFRYFEQARAGWFQTNGLAESLTGYGHYGPIIVTASCDYIEALTYPASTAVDLFTAQVGRTSFHVWHRLAGREDPARIFAIGHATVVWMDYEAVKPEPLPASLRALLEGNRA